MHRLGRTALIAVALASAACSRANDRSAMVDSSLSRDLTTASQVPAAPYTDTVSSLERTGASPAPVAVAPQHMTSSAPPRVRHTATRSTRHRSSSAGEVSRSSAGSVSAPAPVYTPAPRTETVKHTKRDAAIGAAAGAILGAATSRDKIKGGIIGGAAGAILGGIIGNNVDKKKKTVP